MAIKWSSALEVKYAAEKCEKITGILRADLMNMGLSLQGSLGNFNWKTGFRIAYPTMFLKKLQTQGDYNPSFSDVQFLGNYTLSSTDHIEAFILYSVNKYELLPKEWLGHFQTSRVEIHQVNIDQNGKKDYKFNTALAAIKYLKTFGSSSTFSISASKYISKENENSNITGNIFHSPDATFPDLDKEFLFTRLEKIDNKASLTSNSIQGEIRTSISDHVLTGGLEFKNIALSSEKNESYIEDGPHAIQINPLLQLSNNSYNLNSLAFYIEDSFPFSDNIKSNIGVRFLKNYFTHENLLSPRASISYTLNAKNVFNFKTGIYYQPPFFSELTGLINNPNDLKSQRAIHYSIGWKNQLKEKITMSWEVYYKKLNNLVPFYYEDLKMIPIKGNVNEGYSLGLDVMFQGEIIDGIESWLGYSYLDSKEKETNSGKPYRRRLIDQTHTIQIFLQDHFRKHPNWQSHLRLLAGSGFLYNVRKLVENPQTKLYEMVVELEHPQTYMLYLRADMGLSATFDVGEKSKLVCIAEVLNVFDKYNYGGFDWVRVYNNSKGLVNIPKVLSKRFFNFKIELYF